MIVQLEFMLISFKKESIQWYGIRNKGSFSHNIDSYLGLVNFQRNLISRIYVDSLSITKRTRVLRNLSPRGNLNERNLDGVFHALMIWSIPICTQFLIENIFLSWIQLGIHIAPLLLVVRLPLPDFLGPSCLLVSSPIRG